MAPEIKSKGAKARRLSGQTLRLRKKRWLVTGLKADKKCVASSLPADTSPNMHPTSKKSEDRQSFLFPNDDEMVEVNLEDPWVRREDYLPKRCGRGYDVQRRSSEHGEDSLSSDKQLLSDDKEHDTPVEFKSYKRRFYILFLFSVISFSQYCAWNTYGPIATTAKMVFGWTNTEIAFLASMDPITYLCSMLFFSWMMDEKGLRLSIIISCAFMLIGTGLRCVTSHPPYAIWTMGAGQLLNGLAGPVTQAAPTLLSSTWFPSEQRTTSTAVAALCGSLGVAVSFVVGPLVVTDIKYELDSMIPDRGNVSRNLSDTLDLYLDGNILYSDSIYRDASYYWPLDNLNITVQNVEAVKKKREETNSISLQLSSAEYWGVQINKGIKDFKTNKEGLLFNECVMSQGVVNHSLQTDGKGAWVNFGSFINTCVSDPSLCPNGLTVALWIKYQILDNNGLQYFMGTSGNKDGLRGFLIYQDFPYDREDHLAIKIENGTVLWKRSFAVPRDTWTHVTFTWDELDGLVIYANGSSVGGDPKGKTTEPEDIYFTTFTLGRPNNAWVFSKAAYDEIAMWERKLHPKEIDAVYQRTANIGLTPDLEKAKARLIKEGKKDIMTLLHVECGVVAFLFLLVVIYFPNKPPLPPSKSAKRKREDFFAGAKQIFKNKQFWTLALVYGVTTGVYSGWGASLAVNLETFSIGQSEAGWIGFYATIAGIGAGLILARCADLFGGKMKALLLVLFFGSSACFLWFSLLCLRMIEYDDDALYKSSILGGFFVSGTIPLFYELTVESTYPVAEGITTGALTLINNSFTVIFLLILMIPGVGTIWMNWCMFGACAGCIPILLGFHENYRRLDIDKENSSKELKTQGEVDKNPKRLKSPIGSILSFTHVDELVHKLKKAKESNI
ncbi:Solute carrier 49 member 4 [Desmophyllum pertusum]|uniref:Solute carrier 49 member 4 n=1 Tax=Desmophyllum pertusum TaxID=174260 RepID=A0A9W9ZZQ7_9CNID|nr:Solute carrier 49 member 4 [Desmophyllum pertusum]